MDGTPRSLIIAFALCNHRWKQKLGHFKFQKILDYYILSCYRSASMISGLDTFAFIEYLGYFLNENLVEFTFF